MTQALAYIPSVEEEEEDEEDEEEEEEEELETEASPRSFSLISMHLWIADGWAEIFLIARLLPYSSARLGAS